MKKKWFLLLSGCFMLFGAFSQKAYWQQQVNYVIDVTLDDSSHSLEGFLKIQYINRSPDSLPYLWFHIWPNAYKNDRTQFSEQFLQNGRTDFYFAGREDRGYLNRLDFRVNNEPLKTRDHPSYIDVIQVMLPRSLAPGDTVEITTPFHLKLPFLFSRGGHKDQYYQVCQWYPKPAVYDRNGWHPMPYVDQGEFYSEFGNFDVRITLPKNYVVAAPGVLQNEEEKKWLMERKKSPPRIAAVSKTSGFKKPVTRVAASSSEFKTLRYIQENVHDFAWFADKEFLVDYDTIRLPSGKSIDAWIFKRKGDSAIWSNAISFVRSAIRFRSALLGDYPYESVSVVSGEGIGSGGMEYPGITVLSGMLSRKELDFTIEHELGHNWFYGMLATNEREFPWMDEGLNSYYDLRYLRSKYGSSVPGLVDENIPESIRKKLPENEYDFPVRLAEKVHRDQPADLPALEYRSYNYNSIVYLKTARWMELLEKEMGSAVFDGAMRIYAKSWKNRHPYPSDFREILEKQSGLNLESLFALLHKTGPLVPRPATKKIRLSAGFNFRNTDSIHYLNFFPAAGINNYDGFMLGLLLHNYTLPLERFRFFLAPLYGFKSSSLSGLGSLQYNIYPSRTFYKIQAGIGFSGFSNLSAVDSSNTRISGKFRRWTPSIRLYFREPKSTRVLEKWLEWKLFLINEKGFNYILKSTDSLYYASRGPRQFRYLNQLSFSVADYRVLYPYDLLLQFQQGAGFYRASLTGNYFFNYPGSGGASLRFFAAKFGYLGAKTLQKEFATYEYQPKLTAVRGYEDYTYSNYFIGRNEQEGIAGQQIMMRDGGLKIRTDLFQGLQGRSENWIAAFNFNTTLPPGLIPSFIPLRIFFDVGTYAEAWKKESGTSRFLFVGGLQVSLFKNLVNIYAPLVYSQEFRDNLKTVPEENKFLKKISFSIDIQRFNLRRLTKNQIPL